MEKVLVYDVSNYLYASYFVSENDPNLRTREEKKAFWKFILVSMILNVRNKYDKPKEVVLAIDSKNTWRKDYFKYYKARRVLKKEKDDTDWDYFYTTADSFIEEIKKHFPFKVVKVDKTEADDIIAVLSDKLAVDKEVIIVSRDKDFYQLLRNDNIKIYNPITNQEIVKEENPIEFLTLHILKGDANDDVPNIFSDDNVFVNSDKRQKAITKKITQEVLEEGLDKFVIKNGLIDNYNRNRKLIELSSEIIPEDLVTEILYKYNSEKPTGDFESMLGYISKNKMDSLLDQI